MAELGLCSRREADAWIERGWVFVDGERITVLGTKVLPDQRVSIDKRAVLEQQSRISVLINKPLGYVSGQAEDGYQPASVLVTESARWRADPSGVNFEPRHLRHLAPAGRLDIDSTGLLVLTQDGRIARQLIGADASIEKEYLVRVLGELVEGGLEKLRFGLEIDGSPLLPAAVNWQNRDQLRFVLKEGKKRQIRRMCELVGLRVTGLKRVRIGQVRLGELPVGQWRYLAPGEQF